MKLTTLSIALAGAMFFVGCGDKPGNSSSTTTSSTSTTTSTSTSTSTMSDESKFKLMYAAGVADPMTAADMNKKMAPDPVKDTAGYTKFMASYTDWCTKGGGQDFAKEFAGDKAKAADYVKNNNK